jgi:hypothetical protein
MITDVPAAGLVLRAAARWPEPGDGAAPPALAGFVVSSFSPLVAAVAERCLVRGYGAPGTGPRRTAVVIASVLGDVASAVHVAEAVDHGTRIGPLLFYQSVPNAVAGYVAARWRLSGPVVCTSPAAEELPDGLAVARLLIDDGDCDEALVVVVAQGPGRDCALAVLVGAAEEET